MVDTFTHQVITWSLADRLCTQVEEGIFSQTHPEASKDRIQQYIFITLIRLDQIILCPEKIMRLWELIFPYII